jgi:WD40 repeat protein
MEKTRPVLVVEPNCGSLLNAAWSPSRDAVIACCTSDGKLVFYDLLASQGRPVHTIDAGSKQSPAFALAFCPARPNWIATGDGKGTARVYSLAQHLYSQQPRDPHVMRQLCRGS